MRQRRISVYFLFFEVLKRLSKGIVRLQVRIIGSFEKQRIQLEIGILL